MKNFIILCCSIVLLLFFPMQFITNQINHYRISALTNIVHRSAQVARIDGYFTQENIDKVKEQIQEAFPGIGDEEIRIDVDDITQKKYRLTTFDEDEMINYEIGVPIKKVLAMHQFLNIPDADNEFEYVIKGKAQSEKLP